MPFRNSQIRLLNQIGRSSAAIQNFMPHRPRFKRSPWNWRTWALLAFCGLCGGLGHYFVALAHRYGSAARLGPFLYQQIVYMSLGGWLVFGQVPDRFVVLGAVVVVGSGLYLLWHEMRAEPLVES